MIMLNQFNVIEHHYQYDVNFIFYAIIMKRVREKKKENLKNLLYLRTPLLGIRWC